ncbi:hypothetical protein [Halapricum salinum]|uniref:Uncharacterized protein n=1 Tax=Halapricum salinum TaxID=1457250 RepID=A0A4D6HB23_9EURY|nr:hypothetical protein [Halapricum salinum]QCC51139.1 hypothetical protein DV733_07745 [Halapricum salinum]
MEIYGIPVVVFGWVWIATFFGSVFALVYAVSADARARGVGGSLWAGIASLLLFPALWYWWRRGTYGVREYGPTTRERQARAVAFGIGGGYFLGAMVAPPGPITLIVYSLPLGIVGTVVAYVILGRQYPRHPNHGR